MATITVYKGTEPWALLVRLYQVVICQDHCRVKELDVTDEDRKSSEEYRRVLKEMQAADSDHVQADMKTKLRVRVTSEELESEYVDCDCMAMFYEGSWQLHVNRAKVPLDFKDGLYRFSIVMHTQYGFWNENKALDHSVNEHTSVRCRLDLKLSEWAGEVERPRLSLLRWFIEDFRDVFQMK